jgi:hypothetical protein
MLRMERIVGLLRNKNLKIWAQEIGMETHTRVVVYGTQKRGWLDEGH